MLCPEALFLVFFKWQALSNVSGSQTQREQFAPPQPPTKNTGWAWAQVSALRVQDGDRQGSGEAGFECQAQKRTWLRCLLPQPGRAFAFFNALNLVFGEGFTF